MIHAGLTAAVTELLENTEQHADDAFAARHGLTIAELEAVRRGDANELVALGLDPETVWPAERPATRSLGLWLLARAKQLSPAALIATSMFVAAPAAVARTRTLPRKIVGCAYSAGSCSTGGVRLGPGETVSYTKQQLQDACKDGGYAAIGTRNQGECVSFVDHTFPNGITVTGGTGADGSLVSDGNGGLIAN